MSLSLFITLHTAEMFIGIITFFIAYLVVITISNVFRIWVAYKVGDDTGVRLGYLTLLCITLIR